MNSMSHPPDRPAAAGSAAESAPGLLAESTRVEAFSDGVFAIAITLLVLDLKAPVTRGAVLRDLLVQWPAYVAYLASFGYIGVIWVNHHYLFTRIARVNGALLWRNLALLLAMSVLPFPTAVVASAFQYGDLNDERTAVVFYALVAGAAAVTWLVLFHLLSRAPYLLQDEADAALFATERRRAVFGITLYALSAATALWSPVTGLVVACILPVFYGMTSTGWRFFSSAAPSGPVGGRDPALPHGSAGPTGLRRPCGPGLLRAGPGSPGESASARPDDVATSYRLLPVAAPTRPNRSSACSGESAR